MKIKQLKNGSFKVSLVTRSKKTINAIKETLEAETETETIEAIANKLTKEKLKTKLKGIYQVKDLVRIVEVITGNTDKIKIKKAIKIYLTNEQITYRVHRDGVKLRKGYRF